VSTRALRRSLHAVRSNHPLKPWGKGKRGQYALNNFCHLARLVALGSRHFLHDGWVHSHPVGPGRYNPRHQAPSRAKD